jgi:hypothetical protein
MVNAPENDAPLVPTDVPEVVINHSGNESAERNCMALVPQVGIARRLELSAAQRHYHLQICFLPQIRPRYRRVAR